MKTGQWNASNQGGKENEKEEKQSKGHIGHHQVDQYSYYKNPRRRRKKEAGSLFKEIVTENFSNPEEKNIGHPDQGNPKIPNKMNQKRFTLRCIIINLSEVKDKEIILQAGREANPLLIREST